jgi:hypothetical protein
MLEALDYPRKLFTAGARASALGIALLDSEARFESVNAPLARETQALPEIHVGKSSREIVGDIAGQIEPTYERVLRTGKPESVFVTGHIRDAVETGYWLDYCFPILNSAGRVQQLGLFVVNINAERAATQVFDALGKDSKRLMAEAAGLLSKFDQSITNYHLTLKRTFKRLALSSAEPGRRVEQFRYSIRRLDEDISLMRELIYSVISHFRIPQC